MINWNRQILHRGGRLLLCLLCAVLAMVGNAFAVHAKTDIHVLNASGNRNIAPAVDPIGKTEGYSTVLYNSRNGLPVSGVNAIAQTGEGFLWIGSYAGLIRYDGNTFEQMYDSTKIANVRSLYVDSRGRLWIGSNDSGLFLMEKDTLRQWDKDDGLESLSIRIITEDESGLIYISGAVGMATIDEEQGLRVLTDERITGEPIRDIRLGGGNLIYGLTRDGDIFTMEDGRILTWLSHDECRVQGVTAILPDPKEPDKLYLGTDNGRICFGSFSQNFSVMGFRDIVPMSYVEHLEWIGDQVWICAENGIGRMDSNGFHLLKNVPLNNSIEHVMTDTDGNLWFTSSKQGVMKIVPNRFTDLFERNNLPETSVCSTCMVEGKLFTGTAAGLIVMENNRIVDSIPLTRAATASGTELDVTDLLAYLDGVQIRSVIRDSMNRIWISTWRSHGLVRYDHGEMTVFSQEDGLFSTRVRSVLECDNGDILVANSGGVNVIRGDQVVSGYGEEDGILVPGILTMVEAENHDLIFGSDGGGIYIVSSGEIRQIGLDDGLSSEVILRIKRCASKDLYWIVTGNSLAMMTPDYQVRTIQHFPYPNNYDLYENSQGDVWILCSSGIYMITADELFKDDESMDPAFFGVISGLPYAATANSFSELTEDGNLYIAGAYGVIKVNIEHASGQFKLTKVAFPCVEADGNRYYPNESGTFVIPADTRNLKLYPFVINYSLMDPHISYRLDGFDLNDNNVSHSELGPVSYNNLKIGSYQFILTVKDPSRCIKQKFSFRIIKGMDLTSAAIGTIIISAASLTLMWGLVFTFPQRKSKRNRRQYRMFLCLIISGTAMALGEILSFILEYFQSFFARGMMIGAETVIYIALVLFPYLLFVYLNEDYHRERGRFWNVKWLPDIPCFVWIAAVLVNLFTGWLFTVGKGNVCQLNLEGVMVLIPLVLVLFYLLMSLIRMYHLNRHLEVIGILLIVARIALDFWFRRMSSTSLIYALILVYIRLYTMNRTLNEEVAP